MTGSYNETLSTTVSVSSRSYILSYFSFIPSNSCSYFLFPSPLGVIFSLIFKRCYFIIRCNKFPSPLGVIFSLILFLLQIHLLLLLTSFRLLSELYSLLLASKDPNVQQLPRTSFRLLSELYSLLSKKEKEQYLKLESVFPSPLGVIFSLILHSKNLLFVIVYKAIIV